MSSWGEPSVLSFDKKIRHKKWLFMQYWNIFKNFEKQSSKIWKLEAVQMNGPIIDAFNPCSTGWWITCARTVATVVGWPPTSSTSARPTGPSSTARRSSLRNTSSFWRRTSWSSASAQGSTSCCMTSPRNRRKRIQGWSDHHSKPNVVAIQVTILDRHQVCSIFLRRFISLKGFKRLKYLLPKAKGIKSQYRLFGKKGILPNLFLPSAWKA